MQAIFSVHDSKAQAYLPPFYMRTKGEALRAFETTVKDTNTQFNKYPSDYTLVELGSFDEATGVIETWDKPIILENASVYLS